MIGNLLYFAKIALIAWATFWLVENPGQVRIIWQGWQVDTSTGIFVALILLLAGLLVVLMLLFRGAQKTPGHLMRSYRAQKKQKAYALLGQGFLAIAQGQAQQAGKISKKLDQLLEQPEFTLLLAAQTAQLNGDDAAATAHYKEMLSHHHTALLGLKGLFFQARDKGDHQEALQIAEKAKAAHPNTPWVIREILPLQLALGLYEAALKTLAEAAQLKLLDPADITVKKVHALTSLAAIAKTDGDFDRLSDLAEKAYQAQPANAQAAILYADGLAHQNKTRKAFKILEKTYALLPNEAVAIAWLNLHKPPPNPVDALRFLQNFTVAQAEHPVSLLLCGKAALTAKIWGEARRCFQRLLDGQAAPEKQVYLLMSRLENEEHHDYEKAQYWLKMALDDAVTSLD